MGNSNSVFTESEFERYELITYLKKDEILAVYSLFHKASPIEVEQNREVRLPYKKVMQVIPELRVNPFAERICRVFSSATGKQDEKTELTLSFDDLLDVFSVLSPRAPPIVKARYAFEMFDFDGDSMLSPADIRHVIKTLVGNELKELQEEDINQVIESILREADLDGDRQLSQAEFEHAMSKVSDFQTAFRIRLS